MTVLRHTNTPPAPSRAITRRTFLAAGVAAAIASRSSWAGAAAPRPPRLLYANDTTNILSCLSPWHARGEKLSEKMILASVDEAATAGADAHLLQPGLGWLPWWPSKVAPIQEHVAWYQERFKHKPALSAFQQFVLDGGDFVKLALDRCRQRGMSACISFRLNDAHHKGKGGDPDRPRADSVGRFYVEHPEHRLGKYAGEPSYVPALDNWALDAPRDYKFRLIEELCRNYDLDGFELDFLRHPYYFQPAQTTPQQRREVMTGFVARVRKLLEETARAGKRRSLCVRIPSLLEQHDPIGVDVREFASAGVDWFNLSTTYQTDQQSSLAQIRKLVPDSAVYLEIANYTAIAGPNKVNLRRIVTAEQAATAAHLAYARGADGISLFNFQYFRETPNEANPPNGEPPFDWIKTLKDPARTAAQPQHYLVAVGFRQPRRCVFPMPCTISPDQPGRFTLDLAPPPGGWKRTGKLRIQSDAPLGESRWQAGINGKPLIPSDDITEPYPDRFTQLLGRPEELRAWSVPVDVLRDAENAVEIRLVEGKPATIVALDLALP